jgi:glycosyltransferase involved in cell wall biosynthesis
MDKTVAIVINTSWNIYNFRLGLLKALQQEGLKIVVIAPKDDYSEKFEELGFEFHSITIKNKGKNPVEDLRLIHDFYKLYKQVKPHVVLHYTIKPNIYGTIASAHLLNIPTINNIAGLGTLFVKQDIITKLAKLLYRFSQTKAKKIFFQNKDDLELFTFEKLVDKSKCEILPGSGVNIDDFHPLEQNKDDNIFKFLLISRMLWEKGINEYVEAAKIIKSKFENVDFQLLGFLDTENPSAITKKQMSKWITEGMINYLGKSDNVKEQIAKADCVVLPSFYREGTPRVLLESASMEKPIITTDNIGCKDVVDDGINGFLCEVKNSQDLADKMEMMINLSEEDRKLMGKKGREKIINQFDEKIVIQKYLKAIKIMLNEENEK